MTRITAIIALAIALTTAGCASTTLTPEQQDMRRTMTLRQGTVDRNCQDFEKAARPAAISDCRYYARRARYALPAGREAEAISKCGLPKTKGSARATALHNQKVARCYGAI